jgi:ubiquinone biosynthesis protein COQ4
MSVTATSATHGSTATAGPAAAAPQSLRQALDAAEARYMQGTRAPATSSVLISNSKYLNSPNYRDAFAQSALRRHGHDLPPTYMIPAMIAAIEEVTDYDEVARLIDAEKKRIPEFGAWVDARRWTSYRPAELLHHAAGTLGAAIRAFLEVSGMNMEFIKAREVVSDIQYIRQRRVVLHDIEHLVTGFGPNSAGEQALALCNIAATARYFTPALAQYFSHATYFVASSGFTRAALHYHGVLPTYFEAMQQGIAVGLALEKPLFLVEWEDYLDRRLEDIAAELGFVRGPAEGWAWTNAATTG